MKRIAVLKLVWGIISCSIVSAQQYTVSTLAGSGSAAYTDGIGTATSFNEPGGIALDTSGNLYVSDGNNNCIRKIVVSTGIVTTFAGSGAAGRADGVGTAATFNFPGGLTIDNSGNMYVADTWNHLIRKIAIATGLVSTVAGSGLATYVDGVGSVAAFYNPGGITVDNSGNLYVADTFNNRIRKIIISSEEVSNLAGSGLAAYIDGVGTAAAFNYPWGITIDTSGNLYVGDSINNLIRKIVISTGAVETLAGSGVGGYADGVGTAASFHNPDGIAIDTSGNLYVGDGINNLIRKIVISTRQVLTVAGSGSAAYADGTDAAASFNYPIGIVVDDVGNLYVADTYNHRIRMILSSTNQQYTISTLAGSGLPTQMDGVSTAASFYHPYGITADTSGNMYVADTYNHCIRKIIVSLGFVTTLAGSGVAGFADGVGTKASFNQPCGVVADNSGNLYVADNVNHRIRKIITSSGLVSTFAGSGSVAFSDGIGAAASFYHPFAIVIDISGNMFVADSYNHCIRKITISSGLVSTVAGSRSAGFVDGVGAAASFNYPQGITVDDSGNLYVADSSNNCIRKIIISSGLVSTLAGSGSVGNMDGIGTVASFNNPVGIRIDTSGNLYVADASSNLIRKIVVSSRFVLTMAGSGSAAYADGVGTLAAFNYPSDIFFDSSGNLYVADTFNNRIRVVTINSPLSAASSSPHLDSQWIVSTIAGSGVLGYADGVGTAASFNIPVEIKVDGSGHLYVADSFNNRIRKIVAGVVSTLAGSGTAAYVDGVGTEASFNYPTGIAIDDFGNLYVADTSNNCIRKIVISTGEVSTVAGSGSVAYADGVGATASFSSPQGITVDDSGNLFIADSGNHRIRKIVISSGLVSTIAGTGSGGYADGVGTAASFYYPYGITVDRIGNLYLADTYDFRIRKVVISTGEVSTIAGSGVADFIDGVGTAASFNGPYGITADGSGNLFVADTKNQRIRKIVISTGMVSTIAGSGLVGWADGAVTTASFYYPEGIAVDSSGSLYVVDTCGRIRKIAPVDCSPGYYYSSFGSGITCAPCSGGTFSSSPNSISCNVCPSGQTSLPGASACSSCPAGSFTSIIDTRCVVCAPGFYSPTAGSSSCSACNSGLWSPAGSSQCNPCPAGYFSFNGQYTCLPCPAGLMSSSGASQCSSCPAGTYSPAGASICSPCPAGTYSFSCLGTCSYCPSGLYSLSGMSICSACPAGKSSIGGASSCTKTVGNTTYTCFG